jgi:aspartyl-tRNA(Asn)/glutamyl-tRNA(Gln) amidotransferase subunit B
MTGSPGSATYTLLQRMTSTATRYEAVIGLEVHSQLLTASKMFCSCSAAYAYAAPNTHVCPVCLGMPGVLPVINRRAVELTILTGLALNCRIPARAKFDRKNYPYPDLMKGYQISQYDMPLCVDGWLDVEVGESPSAAEKPATRRVGITRVHLEEDTARLLHRGTGNQAYSLLDVNRSGTPLMEIVSEPDMRSAREARAYLVSLRQILQYIGVTAGNLEEGNFRCDANVSLRREGASDFGAKVEIKNMNSFRSVFRALEYEVERQTAQLDRGESIVQETRGWVEDKGLTVSQRSKEEAHDYRYFPEPDLPPLEMTPASVESLRSQLPELPRARRQRFIDEYGLRDDRAELLTQFRRTADYFEEAARHGNHPNLIYRGQNIANWMLGDFTHALGGVEIGTAVGSHSIRGLDFWGSKISPGQLAEFVDLIDSGRINRRIGHDVFAEMFKTGRDSSEIVEAEGLGPLSGGDELTQAARAVVAANPGAVSDYRAGKDTVIRFLIGQLMKETRGRANPQQAEEALRNALSAEAVGER